MDYMGRVYGDQSRVKVIRAWVYMYIEREREGERKREREREMTYIRS